MNLEDLDDEPEGTPREVYHSTYDEIAKELGVSRVRAGQILENAFKSFRRELFKRAYDKDDLI